MYVSLTLLLRKTLVEARLSKGLSQRDLGRLVGCTAWYVWAIENGRRSPSIDMLERIAWHLDLRVEIPPPMLWPK